MSVIEGMFQQGYFTDSPPTKAEYLNARLLGEMRRFRGKKRLRKKKAKKVLTRRWHLLTLTLPIHRFLDYAGIGRAAVQVQPLPPPSGLPYYRTRCPNSCSKVGLRRWSDVVHDLAEPVFPHLTPKSPAEEEP